MLNPPINELIEMAGSRYALVIVTSKRARQLIDGDTPMVDSHSRRPVSIATQEFFDGMLEGVRPGDSEE